MRRFFIFLYGLTALTQVPFAVGLASGLAPVLGAGPSWGAAGLSVALVTWLLRGRIALARWDEPISVLQRVTLEEPFFVHWCASLASFVLALITVPIAVLSDLPVGQGMAAAYLIALPVAFWGVVVRRRWVHLARVDVALDGLPAAFDGFRIAQLSDIHVGSHCPRERVARWVGRVNALDVDLVALTGDYVTSGVRFHEDIANALGGLRAREGVFAVMGNHDYYGDGEPLMSLMKAQGIRLLRNEVARLEREGVELAVAGVDDVYTRRIDVAQTLAEVASGEPMVMLAHDPRSFPEIAEHGSSLVLSGHTHWGQVGFPWLAHRWNYARLMTPLSAGLHRIGAATLYVNAGLGTTGPPVRFGARPEITLLTLRCK